MNKFLTNLAVVAAFAGAVHAADASVAAHLTTAQTKLSVDEAVRKFKNAAASRDLAIFDVIEHSKLADKVGLKMTDTTVVVFGSPKVGTLLMQCKPSVALELPLKFLFYKDGDKTVIAYEDAKNIAARYGAQECEAVGKLSGAQANLLKEVAQ